MKKIALLLAIVLIGTNYSCEVELFGCLENEGEVELIEVNIETISKIEIAMDAELIIKEGEVQRIQIEAAQNVVSRILSDSEVGSGKWKVDLNGCSNVDNVRIFATLVALEALDITADGIIRTDGVFNNVEQLNLEIDGDGQMKIQLAAVQKVDTEINGDGVIDISGSCQTQSIEISGTGEVNAFNLISLSSQVEIKGDGIVNVFVEDNLSVDFKGSGNVCYRGMPVLDIDISGDGRVNDCN